MRFEVLRKIDTGVEIRIRHIGLLDDDDSVGRHTLQDLLVNVHVIVTQWYTQKVKTIREYPVIELIAEESHRSVTLCLLL